MRLVRAPMRISYIGGGTDYPNYFKDSPGGVISAAINQYVYVYSNPLAEIAEENFRFTYRESESVIDSSEFRHPVVRELLRYLNSTSRVNMGTFADLPSGIGLGGSSAFSVAMAKLLINDNEQATPEKLAQLAINIERNLLQEPGGYQDQYASAYGGVRAYDFNGVNEIASSDNLLNQSEIEYLEERQLMVWVGQTRNSSLHSLNTIESIKSKRELLQETFRIYDATRMSIKSSNGNPKDTFKVLASAVEAGWSLKQEFSNATDGKVNQILSAAVAAGIHSFKLCGAGGSGFVLLMAELPELEFAKQKLKDFKFLKPKIDLEGCKTLLEV